MSKKLDNFTTLYLQELVHQMLSGIIVVSAFVRMSLDELDAAEPSSTTQGGAATPELSNEQSLEEFLAAHLVPTTASTMATATATAAAMTSAATIKRGAVATGPASSAHAAAFAESRATDTTEEHKTHLYDANCRVCRGLIEAPSGRLRAGLLLKSAAAGSSSEPTPSASVSPSEASSTPQQPQQQQQQQPQTQQSAADAMKAHAEEVNRLFAERFLPKPLPPPPPTPTSGTPGPDDNGAGTGNGALGSSLFPRTGPGPQQIAWKGQVTMSDVAAYPSYAFSVSGQIRPGVRFIYI